MAIDYRWWQIASFNRRSRDSNNDIMNTNRNISNSPPNTNTNTNNPNPMDTSVDKESIFMENPQEPLHNRNQQWNSFATTLRPPVDVKF